MKLLKNLMLVAAGTTAITSLASCKKEDVNEFDTSKMVTRYTRDTTSGTREGFFEKIGFNEAKTNDSIIPGAVLVSSNGDMISSINGDEYGIGYVSLASVSSSLKAVDYEGVHATEENVINGTYALTRNFNYITRKNDDMTENEKALVKGFILYMNSQEGLAIIKSKDGIIASDTIQNAQKWATIIEKEENNDVKALCNASSKTTIYFGGSTSVEKMSKALTEAFSNVCKGFEASHNHTGSGDAFKRTQGSDKDSQNKLHIGFLSRDLKSSEQAYDNTSGMICVDGIAVVVNKKNTITNLTANQLKRIYSTQSIKWNEIN